MTNKTISTTGRVFGQKAATLGQLSAAIVGLTTNQTVAGFLQVLFWDQNGRTALWPIDVTNNAGEACCVMVPGRLIVSTRDTATQKSVIREYGLPYDPLASPVLSVPSVLEPFGDPDCRGSELAVLSSGHVVCLTYVNSSVAVHAALRSPAGHWTYEGFFPVPSGNYEVGKAHSFATAVCPWQPAVAAFNWTDAGYGVDVALFGVNADNRLEILKSLPAWINRQNVNSQFTFGEMTPNGELPFLWAVPDREQNRILLSLTNNDGLLLSTNVPGYRPVQNAAHPIIVAMGPDLKPSLVRVLDAIVVSILHPMPLVAGPVPSILYHTGYPYSGCELVTGPETVQIPCRNDWLLIGCSPERRDLVVQQPDQSVALLRLDPVTTPAPIPEPPPIPPPTPPPPIPTPDPVPPPPLPLPPPPAPNTPPRISAFAIQISCGDMVVDREDPDIASRVVWTSVETVSGIKRVLGRGPSVSFGVTKKTQTITATVTDSGGLTGSESFTIMF